MLMDRVYMPAEIAVNSTVEKIQSSIVLFRGYEPGQKCLIKHTITILLTCTFRKLSAIIIAAAKKTGTSINSCLYPDKKYQKTFTNQSTETCDHDTKIL